MSRSNNRSPNANSEDMAKLPIIGKSANISQNNNLVANRGANNCKSKSY